MVMSTEQYGAFEGRMKRITMQVGDLQQWLSEIDRQAELFSPDYREIAIVLNGS